jgi:NAD(P)H-flavin reductase/ferredoxin
MPRIDCEGQSLELSPDQTVLDALLGAGIAVPTSCRAGACQACLVQATHGTPPAASQRGLKESLKLQGYFMACQARPESDLEVSLAGARALEMPARIAKVEHLTDSVLRVLVETDTPLSYRAGQYITLSRSDGLSRAYSIANVPDSGSRSLELHVRLLPDGRMSGWLASRESAGAEVRVRGPSGECFYVPGSVTQPLLLIGTGTGLAPLWGVLNDALSNGHAGEIELWHGARNARGLYLVRELEALTRRHPQLRYRRCVLDGAADDAHELGQLDQLVLASAPSFAGRRVYLCGDPGLVQTLKRRLFLKGAALREIHADAFVGSA